MLPRPQLVGVPYDASSSFLRGSAAAPPLIRQALHSPAGNHYTERGADLSQLADAGDLTLTGDAANARVMIQAGIELTLKNGFQPIALGGDHSITYPIMRAMARVHPAVTILHIDAHGDLYDEFEGDRFSHACPFARIMEEELCARLVQVGSRTLTPHQRDQITRFDVDTIEMQHFAGGARPSIRGPVYLSIDLDGLDPAFAPGVSHREPGGLSVRDVLSMIHTLDGPIVGADVVEFNPSKDLDGITASVAAKITREIAGNASRAIATRAAARGPDAVRSARSESGREPPTPIGTGNRGRRRRAGYLQRQHRWLQRTMRARPSICPGVTSDWRSEWRSAKSAPALTVRGPHYPNGG